MVKVMEDKLAKMQARLDEQLGWLEATAKELGEERASRRSDSAEVGKEPGNPGIAASDREQQTSLSAFVEQLEAAGATSSSTTVPPSGLHARSSKLAM